MVVHFCPNCKMAYPMKKGARSPDTFTVLHHQKEFHESLFREYYKISEMVDAKRKEVHAEENALREWYMKNFGVQRGF